MQVAQEGRWQALSDAATHLRAALELLDRVGAPAQIGAHVDLAICQLDEVLVERDRLTLLRQSLH